MMRFKRVLFIYPDYRGSYWRRNSTPPVGIGILCEILKQHNVDCQFLDVSLGHTTDDLFHRVASFKPDLIGLSLMTYRYRYHYSLADEIKNNFPEIKIVAGGPHVTLWKDKILEQCGSIDFIIPLEGEFTLTELCNGHELSKIKGLGYRTNGETLYNGDREWIEDFEKIPFPTYENFEMGRYDKIIPLCSSRGCPFRCIFCQSNNMGKHWRARFPKNVVDEMQYWYQKAYRKFVFVDDNFTFDQHRVYAICDEIEKRGLKDLHISCSGIRGDRVDYDLLKRMRGLGFEGLFFGVEAGNDKILKAIQKGERLESIERAVDDATSLGFHVVLSFLVGSPYETLDDVMDSIKFSQRYPIMGVYFSNLVPFPGTDLMTWIEKNGKLLQDPTDYLNEYVEFGMEPLFIGPGMTYQERKEALRLTRNVMKEVEKRNWKKNVKTRLSEWGMLGMLASSMCASELGYRMLPKITKAVRRMRRP